MLMQRVAFLLAVAHAAARPVGPRALPRKAVERRKAVEQRKEQRAGWTAKLKFLRDDWQQAVLKSRGGASSSVATPGLKADQKQAVLRPRGGASSLTTLTRGARRGLRGRRAPRRRQGRARAAAGRLVSHREAQDPAE